MRTPLGVVTFVMSAALSLAPCAAAQPLAPPTIQRVTLQPETGVLTITGAGLGADLIVIVDGQPASVLPGSTATHVEVAAPVTILTAPGTYRLTVVDPVRQIGDAFVVASQPATVGMGGVALTGKPAAASGSAPTVTRPTTVGPAATSPPQYASGFLPAAIIEDSVSPYRTAIGHQALASNSTGSFNTAGGYQALYSNTTGSFNTASGSAALYSNTTGFYNTAGGYEALYSNTAGLYNMASGFRALRANTTGSSNTASGYSALGFNTTGSYNTANGTWALYFNSTGLSNTAFGYAAGYLLQTGSYNLFLGADVYGEAADTNTMRIGLPYDSGTGAGQNRTFIAGIHGTAVAGTAQMVYVDESGQLGTVPQIPTGDLYLPMAQLQQQVRELQRMLRDQQTVIDELHARLPRARK